jgi:hypothetical protein
MKWTIAPQVLCGAAAVSAAALPQLVEKRAGAPALPLDKFGSFSTMSIDEAKAGVTKLHHMIEGLLGNITDTDSSATKTESTTTHTQTTSSSQSPSSSSSSHKTVFFPDLASEDAVTTDEDEASNQATAATSANNVSDVKTAAVAVACDPNNPNKRFEWRDYSDSDRLAFVQSIKCLMGKPASGSFPTPTNRWEDIVYVHQLNTPTIHGNNIFLPWHRYYVWTLEQIMRDECGFDRAFPWWDETLDAGNFHSSSIFTPQYFGSLPTSPDGNGVCIEDGVSQLSPQDMCLVMKHICQ